MDVDHIPFPDQVCIIVPTKKWSPVGLVYENAFLQCHRFVWDTQKPKLQPDLFEAILSDHKQIFVEAKDASAKAIADIARIARRNGLHCIMLVLPRHDEISVDHSRVDTIRLEGLEPVLERQPMPNDLSHLHGPFDIIGDVHGCYDELCQLLVKLGHARQSCGSDIECISHASGRRLAFVGDLTDRGPKNLDVLRLVMLLEQEHDALVLAGNHDDKLARHLNGADLEIMHGMQVTVRELACLTSSDRQKLAMWLTSLKTHFVLDGGNLILAHAGLPEALHGVCSQAARAHALYGKPTGEIDEAGYPTSEDWAQDYRGAACVVHGHVIYEKPRILNNVYAIDTGCVEGGELTAMQWPERTFVSVKPPCTYYQSNRRRRT